jgi:hypothetical protein
VIPAHCAIPNSANAAVYVINDSNGSILACYQDPNVVSPPPGEPACPGGTSEYSGYLPGDSRSSVTISDPDVPSGANVWHIPVSVCCGGGSGTPTKAHLAYRWQSPA